MKKVKFKHLSNVLRGYSIIKLFLMAILVFSLFFIFSTPSVFTANQNDYLSAEERRAVKPESQITNLRPAGEAKPGFRIKNKISSQFSNNFANLTGHAWEVRKVVFSPDGLLLASGSHDGSIKLWNVSSGKVLRTLGRHYYAVASLTFSPDSNLLASGGWGKKINLWNVTSGALLQAWSLGSHIATALAFSPDGSALAVGSRGYGKTWLLPHNDTLRLLDISTGNIIRNFTGHTNAVSSVVFSSDGTKLFSGSWDKTVRTWNVATGTEIHSYANHSHVVSSIALSPDGSTIASGSYDKTIKLWDVSSGALVYNLNVPDKEVWSLAFLNDSILAAAVGNLGYWPSPDTFWQDFGSMQDSAIQLWDITQEIVVDTLIGHDHIIESIAFSPDGTILASGSWDWTIKLWGDHSPLNIEVQTDPWLSSTPEEQGMNSTVLEQVSITHSRDLHSLLVVRHGKLVFEKYYNRSDHVYSADSKHVLFSATKSFSSALIGIAIEKGFINGTNQHVLDFFPEYTFSNVDSRKESMTLEHLLTMTCGLTWYETRYNDYIREMYFSEDSVQFVLDLPMGSVPGTYYGYNSGASHLLLEIIQQTTGQTPLEFAMNYLFEPLGIEEDDVVWMADSQGTAYGGIGLFLTPRNLAKFGQLYLNNGSWNGTQIVPAEWVAVSSRDHVAGLPFASGSARPSHPVTGYGYQWWISDYSNFYAAEGYQGQIIAVCPEEDLVVVFTARSSNPNRYYTTLSRIVGAIISSSTTSITTSTSLSSTPTSWSIYLMLPTLILLVLIRKKNREPPHS
ncbi:MAG: serine hydrolase [Candidatus Hodarchaeota archaeon]